jgi:CO/xanthine dehydrogenase FAD-binding subunit
VGPLSEDLSLYLRPTTLHEAISLLATTRGQILAGGTDFYPALGEQTPPEDVLDITAIRELRGISIAADRVRIGGLTTWTEVIHTPLPRCFDALKAAAREIGSVQIQNRGTVAGNLCNASPAADGVPPLLALDAEVELTSALGTRQIPLAEFIAGNRKTVRRADEILSAVIVPRLLENAASAFLKLGARRYLVISISMVAAVVHIGPDRRIAEARVAVGSCSARAQRLTLLEHDLAGCDAQEVSEVLQPFHLAPLSPIDDIRATAAYRRDASLILIRRALNACMGFFDIGLPDMETH